MYLRLLYFYRKLVFNLLYLYKGGANTNRKISVSIFGFSWENCGKPDDPAVLKTLTLASGNTTVELAAPRVSKPLTGAKEVAGFWVKVPCVEEIGSCHYADGCDLLNQLIPPGQDCPEPLHTYGIPCHCPFKAGMYTLPESDFYLPDIDLPYWLTNGHYRVQGVLGAMGKELGCLKITFAVHSNN
uniref:MD-2-related lipid-recognition domain-containing protein n=1 Tax=Oncorhynchus tshawytscha TaxID=74940 RepID=A0AAZ3NPZ7_ONCTS